MVECILGQENVKREHGAQLNVTITANFVKYGVKESAEVWVAVKKKQTTKT